MWKWVLNVKTPFLTIPIGVLLILSWRQRRREGPYEAVAQGNGKQASTVQGQISLLALETGTGYRARLM